MSDTTWSFSIEFTGLFVLTTTPKNAYIAQLIDDAEHEPVFTCRSLDLRAAVDCAPVHKVADLRADGSTLAMFRIHRGAIMSIVDDAGHGTRLHSESTDRLADLKKYFPVKHCPITHDNPQVVFGAGTLSAGRYDEQLIYDFFIDGSTIPNDSRPLALSVVYTIDGIGHNKDVVLDLHPGTLRFSSPNSTAVSVGISNLPVIAVRDSHMTHFDEYARLLGSKTDVMVKLRQKRYVDDPVHCVPARVV